MGEKKQDIELEQCVHWVSVHIPYFQKVKKNNITKDNQGKEKATHDTKDCSSKDCSSKD